MLITFDVSFMFSNFACSIHPFFVERNMESVLDELCSWFGPDCFASRRHDLPSFFANITCPFDLKFGKMTSKKLAPTEADYHVSIIYAFNPMEINHKFDKANMRFAVRSSHWYDPASGAERTSSCYTSYLPCDHDSLLPELTRAARDLGSHALAYSPAYCNALKLEYCDHMVSSFVEFNPGYYQLGKDSSAILPEHIARKQIMPFVRQGLDDLGLTVDIVSTDKTKFHSVITLAKPPFDKFSIVKYWLDTLRDAPYEFRARAAFVCTLSLWRADDLPLVSFDDPMSGGVCSTATGSAFDLLCVAKVNSETQAPIHMRRPRVYTGGDDYSASMGVASMLNWYVGNWRGGNHHKVAFAMSPPILGKYVILTSEDSGDADPLKRPSRHEFDAGRRFVMPGMPTDLNDARNLIVDALLKQANSVAKNKLRRSLARKG